MENFILIGMPGSGKSTVGKILAENIGYNFMDTDDLIIDKYQKPLMDLIEEMGVEGFIRAEGEILETVNVDRHVIATGGSVIYSEKGKLMTNSFMQYKIPARTDFKQIRVDFESSYEPSGPYGAKSIGEIVINTPAPAIADALRNAVGVNMHELPMTPERVLKAMMEKQAEENK